MGYFEKSEVSNIAVFDWGDGDDFGFDLPGGSRDRDSTVVILKSCILYELDCLVKSKTYKRNYVNFKKILKLLFVEPLKAALFRATTNTEV